MNGDAVYCRLCRSPLTGIKQNEFISIGRFVYLVTRDSANCNWYRCPTCKDILCKECYRDQGRFCCEGDYVAHRERAQMLADERQAKDVNTDIQEELMSDHKIVYLIVERGVEPNRQVFWRSAGNAFVCRDGSLNLKLDIHPGLTFNIRDPRSNGEREEAEAFPNVNTGNGNGNGNGTNGNSHKPAPTEPGQPEAAEPARARTRPQRPKQNDDDIPF
ncbi:MAG: hypothetical protein JO314_04955 [Acidobacteria bacterium]|nr:hypothetical protein [Acidobacteriota bacterium]